MEIDFSAMFATQWWTHHVIHFGTKTESLLCCLLQLWVVTEASHAQQRVRRCWRSAGSIEMEAVRPNPTPTWTPSEAGWNAPPPRPPPPLPPPPHTQRCPRRNCVHTRPPDSVTTATTVPISMATCVKFVGSRCCTRLTLSKDEHTKR